MTIDRKISVIGLGYVGLPVAIAFGRLAPVVAFDIDESRLQELRIGKDRTNEASSEDLANTDLHFTNELGDLKAADFHIVTVPTPIDNDRRPDLRPLLSATRSVGSILKKGDIVVYESTVYPGATEEECVPILEEVSGLVHGQDFFTGYSPERINPGDKVHRLETITKVVSGCDEVTLDVVAEVYSQIVSAGVHKAPNIKTAEAAKVIENTQRDLNIALMNELSLIFDRLDLDTGDVLAAAGTKWNFLPFTPGLVGGHCIGVDPYYLTHRAEKAGYRPEVILAGRRINDGMGAYVADGIIQRLKERGVTNKPTVTVLGFTFKEDVPDVRNTKAIDIVRELERQGAQVAVHDPMADKAEIAREYDLQLTASYDLPVSDAIIFAVPHAVYLADGWNRLTGLFGQDGGLVVDVRSRLDRAQKPDNVDLWRL